MHSQNEVLNDDSKLNDCGCNCCLFERNLPVNNIDPDDGVNDDDSKSKNILLFTVHNLLIVVDLWRLSQLLDNDWQFGQSLVVIFERRFVCQTGSVLSAPVTGSVGMVTSPFGERISIDDGASNNEPWSITLS